MAQIMKLCHSIVLRVYLKFSILHLRNLGQDISTSFYHTNLANIINGKFYMDVCGDL